MTASTPLPLAPDALRRRCNLAALDFETTADLEAVQETFGQARALEAIELGLEIDAEGYNLFVLGPTGVDKHSVVRRYLEQKAGERTTPSDWCYVHNFKDERRPGALRLPAGRGAQLRQDMQDLLEDVKAAIPAALETDEYRDRRAQIDQDFQSGQTAAFEELRKEAEAKGFGILQTPQGVAIAPTREDKVLSKEEFEKLEEDERKKIQGEIERLSVKLREQIQLMPQHLREVRQRSQELEREITENAIGPLLEAVASRYADLPEVLSYLDELGQDLIHNGQLFGPESPTQPVPPGAPSPRAGLERYGVNLIVDHSATEGAPIVYESNPTFLNLVGRIEHLASFGTLFTDFQLIRPGALHQANGGYLILDADRVLGLPFAWQALRQALLDNEARIESADRIFSVVSTVSLEPAPIPLDVKVILIGTRLLYYLLSQYDDDFRRLFKVAADFDDRIERNQETTKAYAGLVATLVQRNHLLPFDRSAVARIIEEQSREADDSERLSTHLRTTEDLLREADLHGRRDGSEAVCAEHVERALAGRIRRLDRVQRRLQEQIQRGTLLIDTAGSVVGQVNGLSVSQIGDLRFGMPARITATTRLGKGEIIDIERETEMGGAIHSKGVLILSSYIGARYAPDLPLSLRASLVFEQNYGGVDGDSASVAEACALLSSLADVPILQSLAVTGSVNQHGRVQAVGGVNEKIEGFFEICKQRGLDGSHGVLLPADNVPHLMLDQEVVEAARQGLFQVTPITTIDEALHLLTGIEVGELDDEGLFTEGSVNARVRQRLVDLVERTRELQRGETPDDDEDSA